MTRMWDELANATTIVLAGEPWSAAETLRIIRDEQITMATGVPTQWQLVLDHPDVARTDFSTLRVAGIGAAAIPPELVRRMREQLGCPVITRYTCTEAGVTTSTLATDTEDVIANTVGRPTDDVELRIVDPATGDELPPGSPESGAGEGGVGEILSRSPAMMLGYWKDPELTATVIDADGWLHTGDLGFVGDDGNLRIVGRLKEMYIRGGYNVYPAEVEAALSDHPSIARVAVVGAPDDVLGEIGVAFIVSAADADPGDLSLDALRPWSRERIADYKAPDRIVLVDDLPVTPMMKIDKAALAARAQDEPSASRKKEPTPS
jgi:acyl-CoA synthetase (AMP-forming)/AMP-acid ligase II